MQLSNRDVEILEEIIEVGGKCLFSKRCPECPFRKRCLPEFLNYMPPSSNQRFTSALNVLSYNGILDDEEYLDKVAFDECKR